MTKETVQQIAAERIPMKRKIISIDEEKCNGCGLCAQACHEGAIQIVNNKAKLIRDDYCDGLGDCLPVCPTGAIRFTIREAPAYDEDAAKKHIRHTDSFVNSTCPGNKHTLLKSNPPFPHKNTPSPCNHETINHSQLAQWPVQLKLAAPNAIFLHDANLLIAADCTAYAYAHIHEHFMQGRITLIGCPKLDATDYTEKLREIFKQNSIASITVLRMQVPCCSGLVNAVQNAITQAKQQIPLQVFTIAPDGTLL